MLLRLARNLYLEIHHCFMTYYIHAIKINEFVQKIDPLNCMYVKIHRLTKH